MLDCLSHDVPKSASNLSRHRPLDYDIYGPIILDRVAVDHCEARVFRFNDSASVFGWSRLLETYHFRGVSQALIHHEIAHQLGSSERWQTFLRSSDGLTLRKAVGTLPQPSLMGSDSLSVSLNELADQLPFSQFYRGMIEEAEFKDLRTGQAIRAEELLSAPILDDSAFFARPQLGYGVFEKISEGSVTVQSLLGKSVWDYSKWKQSGSEVLDPFEIRATFRISKGDYESRKHLFWTQPAHRKEGDLLVFDFPLIEVEQVQEPFGRKIGMEEALWCFGLSAKELQNRILISAWYSAFLQWDLKQSHLNLVSAPFRFAQSPSSDRLKVCQVWNLDTLELDYENLRLGPSPFQEAYRQTSWAEAVFRAQLQSKSQGISDWRRQCAEAPPWLDPKMKAALSRIAPAVWKQIFMKRTKSLGNANHPLKEIKTCFSELKRA